MSNAITERTYSLLDSFRGAFSFWNLLKRFFLTLFFAVVLSLDFLVKGLDEVGMSKGSAFDYFKMLMMAVWNGIHKAAGSLWIVIANYDTYFVSRSIGSIIVSVIFALALIAVFFQPISLLINTFDGKREDSVGFLMRLGVTIIVVIVFSSIVYHMGNFDALTTDLMSGQYNLASNVTNMNATIDMGNTTAVINLL